MSGTLAENMAQQKETVDTRRAVERLRGDLSHKAGSRERSIALTKLEEAEMWLDRDMKRLVSDAGIFANKA